MRLLLLLLPLGGCFLVSTSHDDYGSVCVTPNGSTLDIVARGEGCEGDYNGIQFSCEAAESGGVVTVHTQVKWRAGGGNDGCGAEIRTTCSVDASDGDYVIAFGSETADLSVPSQDMVCLPSGWGPLNDSGYITYL